MTMLHTARIQRAAGAKRPLERDPGRIEDVQLNTHISYSETIQSDQQNASDILNQAQGRQVSWGRSHGHATEPLVTCHT